ncbi:MAG: hypothetical protein M3Y87_33665 [Myxococcota bacterium]|nr:hypothetical protein [Myxococcota bacterium]
MPTFSASAPLNAAAASSDRRWIAAFALWLAAALGASASGLLSLDRLPLVPLFLGGGVAALALAYARVPSFRDFAQRIDLRVVIAVHLVRAPIGIAFLVLESFQRLDPIFATRAGWGDILAGALAIVALLAVPASTRARRSIVRAWNVVGLADILMVVATAQYLIFFSGHPETLAVMAGFPWGAIPLCIVPIVIATHLLVFARLRRDEA